MQRRATTELDSELDSDSKSASRAGEKKGQPEEPGYPEAIKAVRETLGDDFAKRLGRDRVRFSKTISARWDCVAPAATEVARRMSNPKCEAVRSPFGLLVTLAADYAVNGPPPVFTPPPKSKEPRPPYLIPINSEPSAPRVPKTYAGNASTKTGTTGV